MKKFKPNKAYKDWLEKLKDRVHQSRTAAVLSVNRHLIFLYWEIGLDILQKQESQGWGSRVIEHLATDLRIAFPDMNGLSVRNLRYMRKFSEAWPPAAIVQQPVAQLPKKGQKTALEDPKTPISIVQQAVAQLGNEASDELRITAEQFFEHPISNIPWSHNVILMEKVKSSRARLWYARETVENGWSRNVLVHQVESKLYRRTGKLTNNFAQTLPAPQSELVRDTFKDPYIFDFLKSGKKLDESQLESSLTERITQFLLEMGKGFAFVGRQFRLSVAGQDFFPDLVFYHLNLRCYVVIELKIDRFQPAYVGQLSFYLSAIDGEIKRPTDNPTIGLLICKSKNELVAQYALRDINKPLGVAGYQMTNSLPEDCKIHLPAVEDWEDRLQPGTDDAGEIPGATG